MPGGLASAGHRGAEPWKAGGPWGSRTVLSNPGGEQAHLLTTKGAPGGQGLLARPGSPAQRHAGDRCRVTAQEPTLHISVFKVGHDAPELPLELPSLRAGPIPSRSLIC